MVCCLLRLLNADPEVLFNRSADLGSIAVDWVNDELYWVEIQVGYRVCYIVTVQALFTHTDPN